MTAALSGLFRSLFPAIVALFCLTVLGGAASYMARTGDTLTAFVLTFGGLAIIVALFGLVAVQIENNALLERIALVLEDRAFEVQPDEPAQANVPAEPAPAIAAARRIGATALAKGRVEPVVTLRGAPALPAE
mgnify:CR=1 FL=1